MKKDELFAAVAQADTALIEDAENTAALRRRQKKKRFLLGAGFVSAACLCLCASLIFYSSLGRWGLTLSTYAETMGDAVYPDISDLKFDYNALPAARKLNSGKTRTFFNRCTTELLSDTSNGNRVISPLNLYMALAMTAECADGESRAQILSLLGADDMEGLRTQEDAFFRVSYYKYANSFSRLASAVFLKTGLKVKDDALARLTTVSHASVYRAEVENGNMEKALGRWLNEQTGGLLNRQIQNIKLSPETIAVLSTTLWYHSCWDTEFDKENTTNGVFHGRKGDETVKFMKKTSGSPDQYREYDGYVAVGSSLRDGGMMWFLLPDPDESVESILAREDLLPSLKCEDKYIITLELPKFDVCSDLDLVKELKELGVTDIFDPSRADFSSLIDTNIAISAVRHAARVSVDEEGVTGAAYTVEFFNGSAAAPKPVAVRIDRPFIFYVENKASLPLFVGTVLDIS